MKRGIALFLTLVLALSFTAIGEGAMTTEDWMIAEAIELAGRIQALGADEAYGRMYTADETLLSFGSTAAQMTIPDASKATVTYLNLDAFLLNGAGLTVEFSEEGKHAMNAQFGGTLLLMTASTLGTVATAGASIYRVDEVYPGFDAFPNAIVLLDCDTAMVGVAFSMGDNGVVTANAMLLPTGMTPMFSALQMSAAPMESRTLPRPEGDDWYKAAALDAAARLRLLMADKMYAEGMGLTDDLMEMVNGYAAETDAGMECVDELLFPSSANLPMLASASELTKQLVRKGLPSQVTTFLLARSSVAALSVGSAVSETLYYSDIPDFESRVVFVDAKTFVAGVSFSSMGKGVVRVHAIPMPADILNGFSAADVLAAIGIAN